MSEEMEKLRREWQAQCASGVSNRTFEDFHTVRMAVWEMISGCNLFVSMLLPTSFERVLGRYPTDIAVHTMRLVYLIAAQGRPVIADAQRMAERMQARGYRAVERAAYTWAKGRKKDNSTALSAVEWIDSVEAAYKMVGNPDQPPPAALLEQEATPEATCRQQSSARRRAEELMAQGLAEHDAWIKATLEDLQGRHTIVESIPGRKRRSFA